MNARNIGVDVDIPSKECGDTKCPFHGTLGVRGRKFSGIVVSTKMRKTAVVEWEWKKYISKFERYEKRRTKLNAHNTGCINAREGDIVTIMECRPLSKSKNFVIIGRLGSAKGFQEKMRLREEGRKKIEKKDAEEKLQEAKEAE